MWILNFSENLCLNPVVSNSTHMPEVSSSQLIVAQVKNELWCGLSSCDIDDVSNPLNNNKDLKTRDGKCRNTRVIKLTTVENRNCID